MKKIITLTFTLFIFSFSLYAQDVSLQRISDLMPQLYSIQGQAFLEELDDGNLILRLSDDFTTPAGPDVRILLGNGLSLSGTVEVVNLSNIGHFNGANTFEVPANVNIEDFDNILFFCVNFQQFWASGSFGDATDPSGGSIVCEPSTVSISNGNNTANICPTDEVSDLINFNNSLEASSGNYAYLITDENDILQEVVNNNSYDFEGTSTSVQRVHGVHFDGTLNPVIGQNRLQTTATECIMHSANTGFVTINKTGTCVSNFQCEESLTATTNWATSVDICPTDSQNDIIALRNNLFIPPGDHYAYLITDANEILQEIVVDSFYNFEGSSLEEQRVYGLHFDGTLNAAIGQNRLQTSASGCFTHSGGNLFLTITKNGICENDFECMESLTATTNWATEVDLCSTDGSADVVVLKNNISAPAGDNYVYLITDINETLQEVVYDSTYNFEGTGIENQRVYGLSYSGTLDPQIGQNRTNTTATNCFIHSGGNLFLSINKTAGCETTSTRDAFLQNAIEIFPNTSEGAFSINYNDASNVKRVQLFDQNGRLLQEHSKINQFEVLNSGMYFIRFIAEDSSTTKKVLVR